MEKDKEPLKRWSVDILLKIGFGKINENVK